MLENCIGKKVTAIKAYGTDRFDFTPSIGDVDFSVGEGGYVVFEFGDACFYGSTDGITSILPPHRDNVHELPVRKDILKHFVGRVLQKAWFEEETFYLQFKGMDLLHCFFTDSLSDRNYFEFFLPF